MPLLTAAAMHGMPHRGTDCGVEHRAASPAGGEVDYVVCSTHRLIHRRGTVAVSNAGGVEGFSVGEITSATQRKEMLRVRESFSLYIPLTHLGRLQ